MKTLQEAIKGACDATAPFTRQRNKALASVKWRLRSPQGSYAGLQGLRSVLTDEAGALVFDARDNEERKAAHWSAVLKVPMVVELVSFGA